MDPDSDRHRAFAETVFVDYHLPFADQEKQTFVLLPFAANKRKFTVWQQTNGLIS
jgi:hypothetical protein